MQGISSVNEKVLWKPRDMVRDDSLQREELHPVEGVGGVKVLLLAQGNQQAVRHKVNVLAHEFLVHANQAHRQRLAEELLLDVNSLNNDVCQPLRVQLVV